MAIVIPLRNLDTTVGLVSRGTSEIPGGGKKFSLLQNLRTSHWLWGALSGGKTARAEDDHSLSCSAEVKNGRSNTSILCMTS